MAYTLLVVDDDREFREEFRDFLYEYNIVEASNGKQALELLSRPNEIDVVILDVVMPGLSGTEVLKRIKSLYSQMPVIILTGHGTKSTVIDALKGKADDYIEKPVEIHKTKAILERLVREKGPVGEVIPGGIDAKIQRVMYFIEKNYDKRVSLEAASELVALSPKYFSRIFKVKSGIGFNEYRLKIRMEKAAELLESTDYNVDEISHMVGYENPESFARLFKRIKKDTPTEYRKSRRRSRRKRRGVSTQGRGKSSG